MRSCLLVIPILFLVACGGAPAAVVPTDAPKPTAIPLSAIDLEPLLIQSGDLPAGVTGSQIRDDAPAMFKGVPKATKALYQQFANSNAPAGGVAVFLYDKDTERDVAYGVITSGMGETDAIAELGEKAIVTKPTVMGGLQFADVLFQRCHAVAHVRMTGLDATAAAAAYAKRLDKRLSAAVC